MMNVCLRQNLLAKFTMPELSSIAFSKASAADLEFSHQVIMYITTVLKSAERNLY